MWKLDTIVLQRVEPKCKECRIVGAGGCTREWVVWLKIFLCTHALKRFQAANQQNRYRRKGEGRGDRERQKERTPPKVHVHLNNLRRGV